MDPQSAIHVMIGQTDTQGSLEEWGSSVVECWTQDLGVAGSRLTGGTWLFP